MREKLRIIGKPIGEIREYLQRSQQYLKQTLLGDATYTAAKYSFQNN